MSYKYIHDLNGSNGTEKGHKYFITTIINFKIPEQVLLSQENISYNLYFYSNSYVYLNASVKFTLLCFYACEFLITAAFLLQEKVQYKFYFLQLSVQDSIHELHMVMRYLKHGQSKMRCALYIKCTPIFKT